MAEASSSMAVPRESLNYDPCAGALADGFCTLSLLRNGRFTELSKVVRAEETKYTSIMKRYKVDKFEGEEKEKAKALCMMEIYCLRYLDHHPLIINLICLRNIGGSTGLVFKYHERGDFLNIIKSLPSNRFNKEAVRFYAGELLLALNFIHRNQIYHRGVHPRHILLQSNGHLVLADFGQAMFSAFEGPVAVQLIGFHHYMSPELLDNFNSIDAPDVEEIPNVEKKKESRVQIQRFGHSMARLFLTCVRTTNSSSSRSHSPAPATESPAKRSGKFTPSSNESNTDPTESCVAATSGNSNQSELSHSDDLSVPSDPPIEDESEAGMTYMLDFYAYGCVIFQLLTGEEPFHALDPFSSELYNHLMDEARLQEELKSKIECEETIDFIFKLWMPSMADRFGYRRNISAIQRHPFLSPLGLEENPDIYDLTPPVYISVDCSYQSKMVEGNEGQNSRSRASTSSSDIGMYLPVLSQEPRTTENVPDSTSSSGKIFDASLLTKGMLTTYILDVLPTQNRSDRLQFKYREQCERYQSDIKLRLAPNKLIFDHELVHETVTKKEKEIFLVEGGIIIMRDADSEGNEDNEVFLIDENDDLRECWVEGGVVSKVILHFVKGKFEFYGGKGMEKRIKNMFRIYGGVNPKKWPALADA